MRAAATRPALLALGLALTLAGCGSGGSRPLPLRVAVSAPLRGELTPIVRAADPRAQISVLSPDPGPPVDADVVIAITSTDFVAHPGLMRAGWGQDSYLGRLAGSVVGYGVAPGNPLRIRGWTDLLRPGVRVALTDPLGSDGGRLEVLSAATAIFVQRHHNRPAQDYVRSLLTRALVAPTEAGAIDAFATGRADVVVATEDRLLQARGRGVALRIVYPRAPAPIVVAIGVGARSRDPDGAQALIDALRQPGPQRTLAADGLRPVLVGFADPDRFPSFALARSPAIMGNQALVARSYFGPTGVARVAQRRRRAAHR